MGYKSSALRRILHGAVVFNPGRLALLALIGAGGLALAMSSAIGGPAPASAAAAPLVPLDGNGKPVIDSLKKLTPPAPPAADLAKIVQDRRALLQLGKALFWDTRVGSDNRTACASCHFAAGADNRSRNQLSPGLLGGDRTFQLGGPNYLLRATDFPLTRHANIDDAGSRTSDINDIVSSQGVQTMRYIRSYRDASEDKCAAGSDAIIHGGTGFNLKGVNTRRVEPRNAPTVINAVFNLRNFWDGRANSVFNGGDPFGARNPAPLLWKNENGSLQPLRLDLPNSALASLSAGPPVSSDEMSCMGRTLANLGRKLVNSYFLWEQSVASDDSVLSQWSYYRTTYGWLIRQAFRPEYWNSSQMIALRSDESEPAKSADLAATRPNDGRSVASGSLRSYYPETDDDDPPASAERFRQIEANFGLFFGLALQAYQSTLVADDSAFDRYMEGQRTALNAQEKRGLALFTGPKANCFFCHAGPALTSASAANILGTVRVGGTINIENQPLRFDTGFFNIGVRPIKDDPGVGGLDPFGQSLSETRMFQQGYAALLGKDFRPQSETVVAAGALLAVDGAFKVPGLRNVELTGPYFHNGGKATLMQVVDFYNRGGDFARENRSLVPDLIRPLGLTQADKNDLVAFLLTLTDERVRYQRAPFDHPSICVPHGHDGDERQLRLDRYGRAVDMMRCIGATGARGSSWALTPFLGLSPFQR